MALHFFLGAGFDVTHRMHPNNMDADVFDAGVEFFARSDILVDCLLEDRVPFVAHEHQSLMYVSVSGEASLIPSEGEDGEEQKGLATSKCAHV